MFTNDDAMMEKLRSYAFHGKGETQYDNIHVGLNSRLDTIQAAILIEKLAILEDEMEARQLVYQRYNKGLKGVAKVPEIAEGSRSAWAQYAIEVENRDGLKAHLRNSRRPVGHLLCEAAASADRLQQISPHPGWPVCVGSFAEPDIVPADAPLSDRVRSGSGHRRHQGVRRQERKRPLSAGRRR